MKAINEREEQYNEEEYLPAAGVCNLHFDGVLLRRKSIGLIPELERECSAHYCTEGIC